MTLTLKMLMQWKCWCNED